MGGGGGSLLFVVVWTRCFDFVNIGICSVRAVRHIISSHMLLCVCVRRWKSVVTR